VQVKVLDQKKCAELMYQPNSNVYLLILFHLPIVKSQSVKIEYLNHVGMSVFGDAETISASVSVTAVSAFKVLSLTPHIHL